MLTPKQKEYLANTTIRSMEGVGVNPSHHNIRKLVENGVRVRELQTEIKSLKKRNRELEAQVLNHREQRKVASKEGRDMRRIIKTLEEKTARAEDRYEGLQSLFSSEQFQKETARQYIIGQIHQDGVPNGPYNPKFKQGFAHFAQKAASLRQARPAAQAFLVSSFRLAPPPPCQNRRG